MKYTYIESVEFPLPKLPQFALVIYPTRGFEFGAIGPPDIGIPSHLPVAGLILSDYLR